MVGPPSFARESHDKTCYFSNINMHDRLEGREHREDSAIKQDLELAGGRGSAERCDTQVPHTTHLPTFTLTPSTAAPPQVLLSRADQQPFPNDRTVWESHPLLQGFSCYLKKVHFFAFRLDPNSSLKLNTLTSPCPSQEAPPLSAAGAGSPVWMWRPRHLSVPNSDQGLRHGEGLHVCHLIKTSQRPHGVQLP